jgi:hypothetical protein
MQSPAACSARNIDYFKCSFREGCGSIRASTMCCLSNGLALPQLLQVATCKPTTFVSIVNDPFPQCGHVNFIAST